MHLVCIAIADICVIIAVFLRESDAYSEFSKLPDLNTFSIFFCKGNVVFLTGAILRSGLLLASATVERFLCVAFPLKFKNWNMLKISKILNVFYFITSFAANGPVGYDLHIFSAYNKTICYVTHENNITVATDQI